jgi:hypothetical protein
MQMGIISFLVVHPKRLIISHTPINLPQIHPINLSLRNFAHNLRRPTRYNWETWYDHIGWHNAAIKYSHIVLDDCEFANYAVGTDGNMIAYQGSLDDGPRADEDVIRDFKRVVGKLSNLS